MLGFSVRTKEAEYPDQKPWSPFSERIWLTMSLTLGSALGEEERAEIMLAVCLRVTMLEIGVVKNLEQAPASTPTDNSSNTGSVVVRIPCF
jgi:hypothetical protein